MTHGKFKLVSDFEKILKYLRKSFSDIQSELYEKIDEVEFFKLIKFRSNKLKPRVEILVSL